MDCTVAPEFQSLYQIEERVRTALDRPLPGSEAHLALAPRPRRGWHPGRVPPSARMAAALVLLYPFDERPHLLLTVRSGHLTQHAGQVSLPGGGLEDDETVPEAALREAFEEVGVEPQQVRLLGTLSTLYIPVSDFALHPVVGVADDRPDLRLAVDEVRSVLEAPVDDLAKTAGPHPGYRWHDERRYHVPYFEVGGERVWGATAMVVAELLAVMGATLDDPWEGVSPVGETETHPS